MKAAVLKQLGSPLVLETRDDLSPSGNNVVVQLEAAALNRRDYWITQGMYPGIQLPTTLGSDGAGVVSKTGDAASSWLGREVIINPGWDWGNNPKAQIEAFKILGMPIDGTFATELLVPAEYLHEKPSHLSFLEAAALPLAGLTAYRALFTQGRLQPGEKVLVSGIGGGVATFALQFACAVGAEVIVTSSSAEKIATAIRYGAKFGYDYNGTDWVGEANTQFGPVDLIIDSAGGAGYRNLLDLAAPGGRIVNYGATAGPPPKLDLFKVFWKQLHLIGSTMGTPEDFSAMLQLVNEHQIKPIVDETLPLIAVNEAIERMSHSPQFGKITLDCRD
ncbi:zinc-binding alcohol dehydrogenase family protein [Blastopirellula marina]|uniref:Alcohol dehydrogenase n=1 Tax=Blastopirellula marina TaxID=124 RepID=A0A2S8GGG0_9BACT|nr:zinc-binding dehydrogenase [Blastopirellula marina]PQO40180.1 alcohol dehydrogenase [Blastopirellula marina]PQO43548.1 alcohol dehydrogenase [Blastopirellula marina]PTL45547.1 alcohol dehydrogenase [Blastopirellula marina]